MEEQSKPNQEQRIPNRKERRAQLKQAGILKYLSKKSFLDPIRANFRAQNIETGKKIQESKKEKIEKQLEVTFNSKLEAMKITWTKMGYDVNEMALLEEALVLTFVKDKDTYHEDKKRAKELNKQAAELKAARNK
jgi:hypothetical protein